MIIESFELTIQKIKSEHKTVMQKNEANIIVVFDGYCVLCDRFAHWLAQKDKKQKVYFTTFESEFIKNKHPEIRLENSVIVIDSDKKIYKKSRAVICCFNTINYNRILLKLLKIVPYQIADILYSIVAKIRYALFGKKQNCSISNNIGIERILK